MYALSGFHRVVTLTKTTIFNWGQECGDFFDPIGKTMLKNKGNNTITELRTILQRESQNS